MHELLREAGGFALSLLAGGPGWLAQHFARGVPPIALWHGIATREGARARRCSSARSAGSSAGCRRASRPATTRSSSARSSRSSSASRRRRSSTSSRVPVAVIEARRLRPRRRADPDRGALGRGARGAGARRGRPVRRGGAAGDDGDVLAGVVARTCTSTSGCPSRPTRSPPRSSRQMVGALPRASAADRRRGRGGRAARRALAARGRVVVEPRR